MAMVQSQYRIIKFTSLILLVTRTACAKLPIMGTYLEPWYTNRSAYHWPFNSLGQDVDRMQTMLLADATGDSKDDLIRVDPATGKWSVSVSNGVGAFKDTRLWLVDNHGPSAERFSVTLNGDRAADVAVYDDNNWSVALSNGSMFSNLTQVPFSCEGSTFRLASTDTLHCVSLADDTSTMVWRFFNVSSKTATSQHYVLPVATSRVRKCFFVQLAETGEYSPVFLDDRGNFYAANENDSMS